MARILDFIELSRPLNGFIAFISVFLGAFIAVHSLIFSTEILLIAIAALLILSAGNAINDYCDYQIDAINRPNRPIPSGRIRRRDAAIFSSVLMIVGIALSFFVNWKAVFIAILVSIILVVYAVWLKRTPLAGNIIVGILTGMTFTAGGIAVNSIISTLIPATFALLYTTAREIVKDIEDVDGDSKSGALTAAVIWGENVAKMIAIFFMTSVILFSFVPFLFDIYSWYYFIGVFIGVDLFLVYCIISLYRDTSSGNVAKIQKQMKIDIFVGLVAIFLG